MTLNKLIYDVREALSLYTDDTEVSDRYIIYLYNIIRADYLRKDLNNYQRSYDISITQTFCESLELVSANECNVDIECDQLLRTSRPIPTPLELHTKVALSSVKPTNRLAIPFNFITKRRAAFLHGAKIKKALYAFLDEDGYIYVTAPSGNEHKLLDCLTITGVFEDPLELQDYTDCCGCTPEEAPCFTYDNTDYPLQPHYVNIIRDEVVMKLVNKFKLQEDKINDDINDQTR